MNRFTNDVDAPSIHEQADMAELVTADVVVVGARCAGAATAMLLAERGHDVVVVDRAVFPSDTISTHAIARTGVVQLDRWGLLDRVLDSGAPAVRDVAFHSNGSTIHRTIKERHGRDFVVAPRRTALDAILVDAAAEAGARIRTGVTVEGVRRDDQGRVQGVYGRTGAEALEISTRVVVGADGLRSRIARSVGAQVTRLGPEGGATLYTYYAGEWPAMEYYLGAGRFTGIFPTNDGEACIWLCTDPGNAAVARRRHRTPEATFAALVEDSAPELADRLRTAERTAPIRGVNRLPNQFRQPVGPGWALVGDAGYHRDAVSGHGISDAFRDAELLADAIEPVCAGDVDEVVALDGYHAARDAMAADIFDITCEMSQFPAVDRFADLQKALGRAVDAQAAELAARPRHAPCVTA
jgi:flavin-dependent dehydrogenase